MEHIDNIHLGQYKPLWKLVAPRNNTEQWEF
jgi:hypothetical protein